MAAIDNITWTCDVCKSRGKSVISVIWCPECNHALCKLCQKQHEKSNDSINHTVITIDVLFKLPPYLQNIQTTCEEHYTRFDSYCMDDEVPLCSKCLTKKHKKCRTKPIRDAIRNSKSSVAMEILKESINDIMSNFENIMENRLDNVTRINEETKQIKDDIYKFRFEINSALDKMEDRILEKLSQVEKDSSNQITKIVRKTEERQKKVSSLKDSLENIQKHATDFQTFFGIRHLNTMVSKEKKHLQTLVEANGLEKLSVTFEINKTLQSLRNDVSTFGEINIVKKPTDMSLVTGYTFKVQVPVRSHNSQLDISQRFDVRQTTSRTVYINAFCQFANGQYAFLDNGDTIIIHNNDGSFSFQFKILINRGLSEKDLTSIDDTTIFLSSKDLIWVIDIGSRKITKQIRVPDGYGVKYFSDKKLLYCTYGYGVLLIDLAGFSQSVWWNIQFAGYVTLSENRVCVTDFYTSTVYMLDNKANLLWRFRDEIILSSTSKVTADAVGNVYVIGRATRNVVFISRDGKGCRQLLVKEDFPNKPWGELNGIHYDVKKNRLIIVNMFGNVLIYNVQNREL